MPRGDALTRILTGGRQPGTALSTLIKRTAGSFDPTYDDGGQVFNVKNPRFGATGDGSTDDTAAIQAAIDAAAVNGGIVYVPIGLYKCSATINIKTDVRLVGAGHESAFDFRSSSVGDGIKVAATESYCGLANFQILGTATDLADEGRIIIDGDRVRVANIECVGSGVAALRLNGDDIDVQSCMFFDYRNAIYVIGGSSRISISNCHMVSAGGSGYHQGYDGILSEGCTGLSITGCTIANCREHGIYIAGTATTYNDTVAISGVTIRDHTGTGIKILGNTGLNRSVSVAGCSASSSTTDAMGFSIGKSFAVQVTGCSAHDNSRGGYISGNVESVLMSGCNFSRNQHQGLMIRDYIGDVTGVLVSGCVCCENDQSDTGYDGIAIVPDQGNAISDISIIGCDCSDRQVSPTQNYGINLAAPSGGSTASNATVFGNTTEGNTAAGLNIGSNWTNVLPFTLQMSGRIDIGDTGHGLDLYLTNAAATESSIKLGGSSNNRYDFRLIEATAGAGQLLVFGGDSGNSYQMGTFKVQADLSQLLGNVDIVAANNKPGSLRLDGGISGSGTNANNLRGSVTFATAGTAAVTFGTAESDASYYVALSGSANETFWVTSKATTGFTLNSSNSSSTATVDWLLIR